MKLKHAAQAATAIALLTTLAACSDSDRWHMKGTVSGAQDGTAIILDANEGGRWFAVDTAFTAADGSFTIARKAPSIPGIYRLRLDDRAIYFPIDSLESLTVTTTAEGFGDEYTLSGSPGAELMGALDRQIMQKAAAAGAAAIAADSLFKRELGRKLLADPAGMAAYYIVNKRVDGVPLFNPANRQDRRIIGAVANAFEQQRPRDPRTPMLRKMFLTGRTSVMEAPELPIFEVELYDNSGKLRSLTQAAQKSKVVLLNFINYSSPSSTLFNSELNKTWSALHSKGLDIYQVSVSDPERTWLDVARNLPWTSVYHPEEGDAQVLMQYNVAYVPTTFVIVNGEIRERIDDPSALAGALAKYL